MTPLQMCCAEVCTESVTVETVDICVKEISVSAELRTELSRSAVIQIQHKMSGEVSSLTLLSLAVLSQASVCTDSPTAEA